MSSITPLKGLLYLTLTIPAVWGSVYLWGTNENDSSSSGYIGGALLTFLTSAAFLFFFILLFLLLGKLWIELDNGGHARIPGKYKAYLVIIVPLTLILAISGFLMGGGKNSGNTLSMTGGEVGSYISASIILIIVLFFYYGLHDSEFVKLKRN